MTGGTRAAVGRFLAAVESGDADAVADRFTERARYANVPHPPAVGRDAIPPAWLAHREPLPTWVRTPGDP